MKVSLIAVVGFIATAAVLSASSLLVISALFYPAEGVWASYGFAIAAVSILTVVVPTHVLRRIGSSFFALNSTQWLPVARLSALWGMAGAFLLILAPTPVGTIWWAATFGLILTTALFGGAMDSVRRSV